MTANFIAEYVGPSGEIEEARIKADDVQFAAKLAEERMPDWACKMSVHSLTLIARRQRPVSVCESGRGSAA
ncbi:MAG: hypothetical protein RLN89_03440 [Parvibaculum sp.]